jgi:hypothetical protein
MSENQFKKLHNNYFKIPVIILTKSPVSFLTNIHYQYNTPSNKVTKKTAGCGGSYSDGSPRECYACRVGSGTCNQ